MSKHVLCLTGNCCHPYPVPHRFPFWFINNKQRALQRTHQDAKSVMCRKKSTAQQQLDPADTCNVAQALFTHKSLQRSDVSLLSLLSDPGSSNAKCITVTMGWRHACMHAASIGHPSLSLVPLGLAAVLNWGWVALVPGQRLYVGIRQVLGALLQRLCRRVAVGDYPRVVALWRVCDDGV